MADFSGQIFTNSTSMAEPYSPDVEQQLQPGYFLSEVGSLRVTNYYLMRWLDSDCIGSTPVYRTWVVTNSPDPTGAFYSGTKCGATAIFSAVIAAEWATTG